MRARGTQILITTAVLALAVAGAAQAQEDDDEPVNVRTSVTIKVISPAVAIGTLSATEKECEPKRNVTLYAIVGGRKADDAVGKVKTDGDGDWVVREDLRSGTYYAIASGDRRGDFNCRDDRSANRKLP